MLDVAATAPSVASAKRGRARAVSVGHGVLDNAAKTGVHFEAVDLIAESLYLVSLYQSASGFAFGVYCGRNVASLTVNLRAEVSSCETILTATRRKLFGEVSAFGGDVSLHLVAEIANSVADVRQAVVKLTELLTEQDFLLACGGGILTKFALTIPVVPIKSPKEKEKNENPCAIATKTVIVIAASGGSKVGK